MNYNYFNLFGPNKRASQTKKPASQTKRTVSDRFPNSIYTNIRSHPQKKNTPTNTSQTSDIDPIIRNYESGYTSGEGEKSDGEVKNSMFEKLSSYFVVKKPIQNNLDAQHKEIKKQPVDSEKLPTGVTINPLLSTVDKLNLHRLNSIFKRDGTLNASSDIKLLFFKIKNNDYLLDHIVREIVSKNWFTVAMDLVEIGKLPNGHNGRVSLTSHSAYEALIVSNNILQLQNDAKYESTTQQQPSMEEENLTVNNDDIDDDDMDESKFISSMNERKAMYYINSINNIGVKDHLSGLDVTDSIVPVNSYQEEYINTLLQSIDIEFTEMLDKMAAYVTELNQYMEKFIMSGKETVNNDTVGNETVGNETDEYAKPETKTLISAPDNTMEVAQDNIHIIGHGIQEYGINLLTEGMNLLTEIKLQYTRINPEKKSIVTPPYYREVLAPDMNTPFTYGNVTNKNDESGMTGGDYRQELLSQRGYTFNTILHRLSLVVYMWEKHHDIVESRTVTNVGPGLDDTLTFFKKESGVSKLMDKAWISVLEKNNVSVITETDTTHPQYPLWNYVYDKTYHDTTHNEDAFVNYILQGMATFGQELPVYYPCTIFKTSVFPNTDTEFSELKNECDEIYNNQIYPFYTDSVVIPYFNKHKNDCCVYFYVFDKDIPDLDFTKLVHTNDMNVDGKQFLLISGIWKKYIHLNHYNQPYDFFIDTTALNIHLLQHFSNALDTETVEYNYYELNHNAKIFDPVNASSGILIDIPGTGSNESCIVQTDKVRDFFKDKITTKTNINKITYNLTNIFHTARIDGGALNADQINSVMRATPQNMDTITSLLVESFEREAFLIVINTVMRDWFGESFFIKTCNPVLSSVGQKSYSAIEFKTNDDLTFSLAVRKTTVLNICKFMETVQSVWSKIDTTFNVEVSDYKGNDPLINGLINAIEQFQNDLLNNDNDALYSILILLLKNLQSLHPCFDDISVLQLMLIFIGFIKSIGDKMQIIMCAKLNDIFKTWVPNPLMYIVSKDRNFVGQSFLLNALVKCISNFKYFTTTATSISGGSQTGGARTNSIVISAPVVCSHQLIELSKKTPESEEAKNNRIAAKIASDLLNVKTHIYVKLGLTPPPSPTIPPFLFKIDTTNNPITYTVLTDILSYNTLYLLLQKYTDAINNASDTRVIKNDATILYSAKVQQKILVKFTKAQLEYIRGISHGTLPTEVSKLASFIVSNLLAERHFVDIIINILNETLTELTEEYTQYIKNLTTIDDRDKDLTSITSNTGKEFVVLPEVYAKLESVITYYQNIIEQIGVIYTDFLNKLTNKIEPELNAIVAKGSRRASTDKNSYTENPTETDLVEDIQANLDEIEQTLGVLESKKMLVANVDAQMKKLDSFKSIIKNVKEFESKIKVWFDEVTNVIEGSKHSKPPVTLNSYITSISEKLNTFKTEIATQNPTSGAITKIISLIKKESTPVTKDITHNQSAKMKQKTTLSNRLTKLTQQFTPGKKTIETLTEIRTSLSTAARQFANRATTIFNRARTGGENTGPQKVSLRKSRKTYSIQHNKRSNRRIRKLGVFTRKRNHKQLPKNKRKTNKFRRSISNKK